MNNLQVKVLEVTPAVVKFNYDEMKAIALQIKAEYDGLIFTDETVKEGKSTVAEIRKIQKSINDFKVKTKKELTQSVTDFESQCKDIIATFDEPLEFINLQLEKFEEKRINDVMDMIKAQFSDLFNLYNVRPEFRHYEINKSWLNVTKKKTDLVNEITAIVKECEYKQAETDTANEFIEMYVKVANADYELNVKLSPDAFRRYVGTLSKDEIKEVINKSASAQKEQEQAFAQREREKAERAAQAEIERIKQEAAREVNEVIEAVEEMSAPIEVKSPIKSVTLKIEGSKEQLEGLREFLERNNMNYTRVLD